jgi:hypothetical protein
VRRPSDSNAGPATAGSDYQPTSGVLTPNVATVVVHDDHVAYVVQLGAAIHSVTECATLPCAAVSTLTNPRGGATLGA